MITEHFSHLLFFMFMFDDYPQIILILICILEKTFTVIFFTENGVMIKHINYQLY